VRDEDHGQPAVLPEPFEQPDDLFPGVLVQVAGRLVGQQHARLLDQRAGDGDPLLLAARQRRGQVPDPVGEADISERAGGAVAALPCGHAKRHQGSASTFSCALSVGIRLNVWKMNPSDLAVVRVDHGHVGTAVRRPERATGDDLPRGQRAEHFYRQIDTSDGEDDARGQAKRDQDRLPGPPGQFAPQIGKENIAE